MSEILVPTQAHIQQVIDRFWETIPPAWHTVRGHLRATAAEQFEITVEQFHILRNVRRGIASVSDLAEVKQISRSAISQAVEALVEKGLITRRRDLKDRRCVQLTLTPTGQELLNGIFQQNRQWMSERLSTLTTEELDEFMRGIELLRRAFTDPEDH
jgi:DNA-binding MarR family transcriptional regulator